MKKMVFSLLCVVALIGLLCVYWIGGMAGAYAWSLFIFVFAPLAVAATLVQLIIVIVKLFKKKYIKWDIILFVMTLFFVYPITILLGVSDVTYPTKANASDSIKATLPIENAVLFGGKNYKTHAVWPSECYAFDILSEPYDTDSSDLESYGIYNAEVFAPVSGTIIGMENNEPDIAPNIEEFTSLLGNYIYIQVDGTNTYMILAHLKKESIIFSVGDHVTEGTLIGRVGNSGTTSEPHLHIQHQRNNPLTMIYPTCAEGLPIIFK